MQRCRCRLKASGIEETYRGLFEEVNSMLWGAVCYCFGFHRHPAANRPSCDANIMAVLPSWFARFLSLQHPTANERFQRGLCEKLPSGPCRHPCLQSSYRHLHAAAHERFQCGLLPEAAVNAVTPLLPIPSSFLHRHSTACERSQCGLCEKPASKH